MTGETTPAPAQPADDMPSTRARVIALSVGVVATALGVACTAQSSLWWMLPGALCLIALWVSLPIAFKGGRSAWQRRR